MCFCLFCAFFDLVHRSLCNIVAPSMLDQAKPPCELNFCKNSAMVQLKRMLEDDGEAQLASPAKKRMPRLWWKNWKCPGCSGAKNAPFKCQHNCAAASPGKNEDTPVKNEYTRFLVPVKNEATLGPKDG